MRILLVEDDNRFADALMVALRRQNFDVSRAATAAAALAGPVTDLVLLDSRPARRSSAWVRASSSAIENGLTR